MHMYMHACRQTNVYYGRINDNSDDDDDDDNANASSNLIDKESLYSIVIGWQWHDGIFLIEMILTVATASLSKSLWSCPKWMRTVRTPTINHFNLKLFILLFIYLF